MKLSTKFALIFSGVILLTSTISFYGIFIFQVDILEREIIEKLEDAATSQLDKLDRMFYERQHDLEILSSNPVILSKNASSRRVHEELEKFLNSHPQYTSASYFTLDRMEVATAGIVNHEFKRHPQTEYWPAIYAGQDQVINISKSASLQVPTLHFAQRVMDGRGRTAGVVVARIPVDELYGLIDSKTNPATGAVKYRVDILDRNGMILYSNHNEDAILEAVDKDFDLINRTLSSAKNVAGLTYVSRPAPGSEFQPDAREIMVIAREQGYREFNGNGWILKIQYANRDAYAPIATLSKKVSALLLSTAVFGIAAILSVLSFTVVSPIRKLNNATARLAQGELDTTVEVESFDEIGKLARSFNEMAANLKEAREQLAHAAETALARANLAERKIVDISEETQQQIGRELHDDLGQQLTGVAFMSEVLSQHLKSQGHPGAESASRITGLVNEAIAKTHKLAHGLYPVEMKESGLRPMLLRLASNTESIYPIECRLICEGEAKVKTPLVITNLFRIAQEAVHNAIKHSGATKIVLKIVTTPEAVTIEIADNGRGMGSLSDLETGGGLGMRTMQYRAALLGATLRIAGSPEGGTRVIVSLPASNAVMGEGA